MTEIKLTSRSASRKRNIGIPAAKAASEARK
jgi:hypothetical protein